MDKFLIYSNNKVKKFQEKGQVLNTVRYLLEFNHGFDLIVPEDAQILKQLDEICKELNTRVEIDPGSYPTALEYFFFGVVGAGLGAAQGAGIGLALWKGILTAITAYENGGGVADIVIPGFGTFLAVGAGIGAFTGAATGVLAAKWKIKVKFEQPNGLALEFYKKKSLTVTFTPA